MCGLMMMAGRDRGEGYGIEVGRKRNETKEDAGGGAILVEE